MNVFLTGCDSSTEWHLMWFLPHFKDHVPPGTRLILADFGIANPELCAGWHEFHDVIEVKEGTGWFKKPSAIMKASQLPNVEKVCWLDTDCKVVRDPTGIFELSKPESLGMAEDRPWTVRRGKNGPWHNSGVVVVEGTPAILRKWAGECVENPAEGDQEVLHEMIGGNGILRNSWINTIPPEWNTLRLDYVDGIAEENPVIIHYTGRKGKEGMFRELIRG